LLEENKTNTLNSSFRLTRWGMDKGQRGLRSPLLLSCHLDLSLKYLEEVGIWWILDSEPSV
jgi:hypothetical protein